MVRAVASPTTHRPPAERLAAAVLLLALCLAGVALTPRAAQAGPGTYPCYRLQPPGYAPSEPL